MMIRKGIFPFLLLLFSISIIYIGYYSKQNNFWSILLPGTVAFISFYFIYINTKQESNYRLFFIVLIFLKFLLIFSFPNLSNDIYRFWWDGWLTSHGQNPYLLTPSEILSGSNHSDPYFSALQTNFHLLNSPEYHSVYPLFCQALLYLGVKLAGANLFWFNLILKIFVIAADIGIFVVLNKMLRILNIPIYRSLLFFGNPLCIIELNNNLHFEIYLILFLVLGIYFFLQEKFLKTGMAVGCSFISKLTSALYLPLFIKKPLWSSFNIKLISGFCFLLLLMILSLFSGHHGFLASIGLYFHQFEFNSFIYKVVLDYFDHHKWYEEKRYIGLVLLFVFIIGYIFIIGCNYLRNESMFSFRSAWIILFSYLILSSTVHPWYICPLILFSCFAYPIVGFSWSYLILYSYVRYDDRLIGYQNYFILLEYIPLIFVLLYEAQKDRSIGNKIDIYA